MLHNYGGDKKELNNNRQPVKFSDAEERTVTDDKPNQENGFVKAIYRNGNVYFESVEEIPQEALRIDTDIIRQDRTHTHRIKSGKVYEWNKDFFLNGRNVSVSKFVLLEHDTTVYHEEHDQIPIRAGKYAVFYELKVEASDVIGAIRKQAQAERAKQEELTRLRYARD